jgi:8-oxo-dGTP diphosphatase
VTIDSAGSVARLLASAGVLFFDERDRLLLVVPSYKDYRDIPGGYLEPGESPKQGAVREVREELGISPPVGRLLVADWAPLEGEGDKIMFIFDGGVLGEEHRSRIRLDPDELTGYEFHDVARIHELTISRLARRVAQAQAARADGGTRYLEHGRAAD